MKQNGAEPPTVIRERERKRRWWRERNFAVPPDVNRNRGPRPVLSQDDREQIRRLRAAGWHPVALARAYGLSLRTIYRYVGTVDNPGG